MPSDFWKQFGDTYDQVNQNTGGLADFVKNKVWPRAMAGMSAFDKTMLESPAGQIAQAIGKPLANAIRPGSGESVQQAIQNTEPLREQYPIASAIGTGAGVIGQMVNAPVAPAAAPQTAAAALLPTLARNALSAGAVTVPGAISQGIQTGNWKEAAKQGLKDTAIGAVLGAGGEKVLGAIPSIVNAAKKTLVGQAIRSGLDIDPRALRKIATYGPIGKYAGAVIDRADDLRQQLINLMVDNPSVKTEVGRRAVVDAMNKAWGKVDEAFNSYVPQAGLGKVRSFQDEILSHPLVQDVLKSNPDRLADLDAIIAKADTGKDLAATRHILQKDYINPSFAKGSKTDDEQVADLARGIHDVIDEHFVPDDLKATYARDKVLKEALMREDLKLPQATQAGSPTFARLAASAAMGGLGGGGGLLAGQDPSEALRTAGIMAAGGLVGGVGGRLGSRMINKSLAGGEARLAQLLGKIPASVSFGVEQAAPRIAQLGGEIPQAGERAAIAEQQQTQPQPAQIAPVPQAPLTPAELTQPGASPSMPTDASALLFPQALDQKPAPEHVEAVQQATLKEQQLNPDQVRAAQDAARLPFEDNIKQKLLNDWNSWQNPYKVDFDTFFDQAKASTNNFDPKNINTAKIVAGPNYKDYLKSYNVALNLQSLGKDLADELGYNPAWGGLLGTAERQQKHNQLVNTLYTAMTGDMKEPDKSTRAMIESRLRTLRFSPKSKRAQDLYNMLQNEYGVRFDLLRQYGAI